MTWLSFRTAFRAAVAAASGAHDAAVIWDRAAGVVADPVVKLAVISDVAAAPERVVLLPDGLDYTRGISQQREIQVQIKIETLNDLHIDDALDLVERTRMGLHLTAPKALLEGALVRTTGVRWHLYRVTGCLVHAWSFDATMRVEQYLADPAGQGSIETVGVAGETSEPTIYIPEVTIP